VLLKLSKHIADCLGRAARAEEKALQSTDPTIRREQEALARNWRHLASSYEFVESLERFLSDKARGKQAIAPPEMPAIVEEAPGRPETKPIVRRRRVKHEESLKDRLLRAAQEARDDAAQLPAGPARERLLQKARQSENAAMIDTWVSSPGSPPPDGFDLKGKPEA
jgi:hypothetical protein